VIHDLDFFMISPKLLFWCQAFIVGLSVDDSFWPDQDVLTAGGRNYTRCHVPELEALDESTYLQHAPMTPRAAVLGCVMQA